MSPVYVEVLLPLPTQKCRYTYAVPVGMQSTELLYKLVCVSFGHGKVYSGLVVEVLSVPPDPSINYKSIIEIYPYPPLPTFSISLLEWVAEYYICSQGEVLKAMIPAAYRPDGEAHYGVDEERLEASGDDNLLRALSALPKRFTLKQFKQTYPETTFKLLLELLHQGIIILSDEQGVAPRPKVIKGWGVSSSFLSDPSKLDHAREMLKRSRGAIRVFEQIVSVHDARLKSGDRDADSPLLPVALISLAERYGVGIAVIKKLRDLGVFEEQEVLLDMQQHMQIQEPLVGDDLSSSLKVQYPDAPIVLAHIEASNLSQRVPYALISETLRTGGQVLLLCPTQEALHELEPLLISYYSEHSLFPFHSNIPPYKRNNTWYEALQGTSGLYVGLRKAVWLPFRALKTVIILDEEHVGYRQFEPAPRFNALNVSLVLAKYCRAQAIMTTASPSVERQLLAHEGRYAYLNLPSREPDNDSATLQLISLKDSFKKNKVRGRLLSFEVLDALRENIQAGGKALLLLHRKGYARYVTCEDCGMTLECPQCNVTYRYFENNKNIVCPLCGHHDAVPHSCPDCGQTSLTFGGTGIERLAQEVRYIYPEVSTTVIGEESEAEGMASDILLSSDYEIPRKILRALSLIVIVQFDLLTMKHDFRANERAYRLLCHCQNEASKLRKFIIQYLSEHQNALLAFQAKDYNLLFEHELQQRALVKYPPFSRMIDAYVESSDKRQAYDLATLFVDRAQQRTELSVFGPAPLPVRKKWVEAGYKLTFMIPIDEDLRAMRRYLEDLAGEILADKEARATRIYFDVDPL
ncbi:replication restart helicase PriA [Porphyromonas cangingivalis]|uniref:replication restart helicase PriA n=1 Tax=Porphyromonas cangingivalis TaxID=36874 RepID=UPI00242CA463|nr:primosomal protein N' [Porphyromonas cangingivalis]